MLALLFAASVTLHGTWSAVVSGDRVHLNMVRDDSNWGTTYPRSDFALSDSDVNSATEKPVAFALKRDAGTIDFTGTFQNGEGVGRFNFTPNPEFAATLRSLGVNSEEPLDDEQLFRLAMHGITTAFIRDMQSLGYHENLDTYIRFRIHGVTPEFIRDMNQLGYKPDAEDAVRFRIHGVTPQFVRDMRDAGYSSVPAEELVRFRIHGVSPQFVRDLRDLGYTSLSSDDLVRFRIHGVSPEFVRELRDLGYSSVSADDLVRFRIHGVTADFIRELATAGYHNIPPDKLVQMKIRGLDPVSLRNQ